MKTTKMLTIVVVVLGLMVWPASVADGAQYLTLNKESLDSIILEVGQSCTFEVVSDDSRAYTDAVGFEDAQLGSFSHIKTMKEAGDNASVTKIIAHDFYGYEVTASGLINPPSPGTHFIFRYEAQQVGETDLVLKDGKLLKLLDSVHIRIVPDEMGTAFTYQGRLIDSNTAADGEYDFEFELYDAPFTGGQLGSTIDVNDLDVIDGYFTVELDFGSGVFDGNAVWLEIGVRPGGSNDFNDFVTLSPRQEVTAAPYAFYAKNSSGLALPYAGSATGSGGPVLSITNTGTGSAIKGTGQNGYGVQGESSVAGSSGVFGINESAGGYGVFGWSDSGTGVKGFTSGTGVAGQFQIAYTGNSNAALEGRTNGAGAGVYGLATRGVGINYAVRGKTYSPDGYAGYFEGRVYASDRVGIGTISPTTSLEVNGQVKITGGSPAVGKVLTSDADGLASWQTPSVIADSDWQVSGGDMYSIPSGNIGIGTTTPRGKLDVEGDGSNIYLDTWSAQVYIGDIDGDGDETLFTLDDNAGKFTFENGNVGIGITNPDEKLTVDGTIKSTTSAADGRAVYGKASYGGDQYNYGGYFESASRLGAGVYGEASHSYGGKGVYGKATGDAGIGVYGSSTGSINAAIFGSAANSSGSTGVWGTASGNTGIGVQGQATNTGDYVNYGGRFTASGIRGRGVYGNATGTYGRGVYGHATGSSGFGGFFEASGGTTGWGVYGYASNTGDCTNYGGYFRADGSTGRGVYGWASNTGNVTNSGGYFVSDGSKGRGVYGFASSTSSITNYGGYFEATGSSGRGVYGMSYGSDGYGVYGYALGSDAYGVYGEASGRSGIGVRGYASYSSGSLVRNYGGWFEAKGSDGRGVFSVASGSNGVGVESIGGQYDFYASGIGINYGPFTGGHEVKLSDDFPKDVKPGMIVSVTGQAQLRHSEDGSVSISSTLPTVKLSDVASDKAVFGVLVAEAGLGEDHWYQAQETERFATVNALGEGRVWVCNINGEIEAGDYITTSSIAGYGQRQDDDLLHSYTLGKAIESIDWDSVTKTIGLNGQTFQIYLIAVIYTSG